jgi:hypothetical protein
LCAWNSSFFTGQALERDEPLPALSALLAEGRTIPLRIREKEVMESRVWAMGWVCLNFSIVVLRL